MKSDDFSLETQNSLDLETAQQAAAGGEGAAEAESVLAAPEPEPKPDTKHYLEAPFSYVDSNNESITLNNGTLQHTVTDFSLPGRNGFDLTIARRYDSDSATLYEMNPYVDYVPSYHTTQRENSHNLRSYALGCGWSFVLPSIEVVPETERNPYITYSTFLHLEDGRTFVIDGNALSDYPLKDVSVEQSSGTLTHPQRADVKKDYSIIVRYKNGNSDYFSKVMRDNKLYGYNLVARKDRFGNAICFDIRDYAGMRIVDSWGRDIALEKQGNLLTWALPDKSLIQYVTESETSHVLLSVTDQMRRVTTYEYGDTNTYKAVCKFASAKSGDSGDLYFSYALLKKITHPTGAQTLYEYGVNTGNGPLKVMLNDLDGYKQYFPIRQRSDLAGGVAYNTVGYSYELAADAKSIAKTTLTRAFGVKEVHSFNAKSQLASQTRLHNDVTVSLASYTYGTDNTKENYKLVTQQIARRYGRDPSDPNKVLYKTTDYAYTADKAANVASVSESYSYDSALNQKTTYTYGANSIVTEKSYLKDSDTTIHERSQLHQNGLVVEFARVFENDALKQKTQFVFFTDAANQHCLAEERAFYAADAQELESATTYRSTNYSYEPAGFTHLPVTTTIRNLYDADGAPISDISTATQYDIYGRAVSSTDGLGNTTQFRYDALGRTVRESYAAIDGVSHQKQTLYNDAKNYITTIDENGNHQRLEYTQLGWISRVFAATANKPASGDVLLQRFGYDENGRTLGEFAYDGAGEADQNIRSETAYSYDAYDRLLGKKIAQTGYSESHSYEDVVNTGNQWSRLVDRHTTTIAGSGPDAPDKVSMVVSDQLGNKMSEWLGGKLAASYSYDKLGNKLSRADALGFTTSFGYDYAGRQTSSACTVGGGARKSITSYDALGNKSASTDYLGNTTLFSYDAAGRLIAQRAPFDERSAETRMYYDAAGNLTLQKIKLGDDGWRETAYGYDARGRQTDVYLYEDATRQRYSQTQYCYDGAGNRTELRTGLTQDSGDYATTRYRYDRFNNVTKITDALGQSESSQYDATGRLLEKTDRNGSVTSYEYDAAGRLLKESVSANAGGQAVLSRREYAYAPGGAKLSESAAEGPDSDHNITLLTEYVYNNKGQLVEQRDPAGIVKKFSYDPNGARQSFRLYAAQSGALPEIELRYAYNELGQLTELRKGAAGDPAAIARYEYDANGNRTSLAYPQNGVTTTYGYNKAGLVTSLENKKDNEVLSSFGYEYSVDGNQTAKTQDGATTHYEYDRLGRLIKESDPDWNTITYGYDPFSNRRAMTVAASSQQAGGSADNYTTNYEYDQNNRLLLEQKTQDGITQIWHYGYDPNGNQISRRYEKREPGEAETPKPQRFSIATGPRPGEEVRLDIRRYNGFNQLIAAVRDGETTRFSYRADGLRHSKELLNPFAKAKQKTVHHWDGQSIVLETNGQNGSVKSRYLRGSSLVTQVIDATLFFYLFNAHGDVLQRVSGKGETTTAYKYDAFGNQKDAANTDPNPFRYCGEYFDTETGEVYLRARYYNSKTGRFGAEDSKHFGRNWYSYCDGNPVRFNDPTGSYYMVQFGDDDYVVMQESLGIVLLRAISEFIPVFGGTIADQITKKFSGKIIGGTSAPKFSLMELAIASIQEFADKRYGVTLDPLTSAVSAGTRFDVYYEDKTLFALMDVLGLPTTFSSKEEMDTQMSTLETMIKNNPQLFKSKPIGPTEKTYFEYDYDLSKMNVKKRNQEIMRVDAQMGVWKQVNEYESSLKDPTFRSALGDYENRMHNYKIIYTKTVLNNYYHGQIPSYILSSLK